MARVLIINDSSSVRARCSALLGDVGYQVVEAAAGLEAIEAYRARRPDGVLLDCTTASTAALQTLEDIMRMDPSARVAMVTAMGQRSLEATALEAGAAAIVLKPFDGSRVLSTMRRLIG